MKIRFVHENRCLAWGLRDEVAQILLRRNAGGGIVRVADVDQALLRGSKHFRKIMREGRGQRNLHDLSTVYFGLFENCLEGWISYDKISLLLPGKCLRAKFQNLAGTVAEQDLIVINAVQFCQLVD